MGALTLALRTVAASTLSTYTAMLVIGVEAAAAAEIVTGEVAWLPEYGEHTVTPVPDAAHKPEDELALTVTVDVAVEESPVALVTVAVTVYVPAAV
jgi:hypothetical protein